MLIQLINLARNEFQFKCFDGCALNEVFFEAIKLCPRFKSASIILFLIFLNKFLFDLFAFFSCFFLLNIHFLRLNLSVKTTKPLVTVNIIKQIINTKPLSITGKILPEIQ